MTLAAVLAGAIGLPLGWIGAVVATQVLDARDEDLPPMPDWVRPITAITVGALCFVVPLVIDNGWVVPAYLWFAALTMTLVVTDVHSQLIPNRINYPGTGIGAGLLLLGALIAGDLADFGRGIAGVVIYFAVTLVLLIVGRGRSFGGGDVKLSWVLGLFTAFLGWDQFATGVVMGFLIGGVAAMALLLVRSRGLRDHFAFGPPMILGAYVGIVWGEALVNWYLN